MTPDTPAPTIPAPTPPPHSFRRWFGKSAWIALAVFILGRLALEPARALPMYDIRGMDAYGAVETFQLRKKDALVKIGFFGTSQSVWGVISDEVAQAWSMPPSEVRNLSIEGGTPFGMWSLIRRNEEKLSRLRVAIVEVNPFVLRQSLDADTRVRANLAQHATLAERFLVRPRSERVQHVAEWLLPVRSVRRPLYSAALNVLDPEPGNPVYPWPEKRVSPMADWKAENAAAHTEKGRKLIPPYLAAKRMVGNWKLSALQDYSLKQCLDWFEKRGVKVILHELPVHPEVYAVIQKDEALKKGNDAFLRYVDTLKPTPVARILTPDPATCGLATEHMADRTHCNELGARIYSRYLAEKLKMDVVE
ncbi:MAG: hypothetical protein ACAH88_16325 [Roseimicrobium sp.]